MIARLRRRADATERGQSLVEMGFILPLLILIVITTLEFGFAFDHHLTLEYATREGARAGAALADGDESPCGTGDNWVDERIVAAVQRVLTSPGSPVDIGDVSEIRIFRSGADGEELAVNVWTPSAGLGPVVDGLPLNFVRSSEGWPACNRNNGAIGTDSVGVSIAYLYGFETPIGFLFGGNGLSMTDRTVMQLNPTN